MAVAERTEVPCGRIDVRLAMTVADEHSLWRRRLAGEWLPVSTGAPECGCYRLGGRPVRIWQDIGKETGEIRILASADFRPVLLQTVWPACAGNPVTAAAYRFYQATKRWPDTIPEGFEIGDNLVNAPDHEQILATIQSLQTEAIAWFESIGSRILTQVQADRAASFAAAMLRLECKAAKSCREACRPLESQAEKIKTLWRPIEGRAADCKIAINQEWLKPYFDGQRAQMADYAKSNAKDPATILNRPKASAGGARSAHVWIKEVAELTDPRAFGRWLLELKELPDRFRSALQKMADQLVAAKVRDMPGVKIVEQARVR